MKTLIKAGVVAILLTAIALLIGISRNRGFNPIINHSEIKNENY